MDLKDWRYYSGAVLSARPPHEVPCLDPIKTGLIWKMSNKKPLFARWTTDYDCIEETNWWYIIKDEPFDISKLKAKRRYEITKGNKNFIVCKIIPTEYSSDLLEIQKAAFSQYPKKYRPILNEEKFYKELQEWNNYSVYGVFLKDSKKLVGYSLLLECDSYVNLAVVKLIPECEKLGGNAALLYTILTDYKIFLSNGGYICDGERNISHETAFADYLEKYFGFRKAYCKLHIVYNPKIKWAVQCLYPLRKILKKLDGIRFVHKINAILKMEEIIRGQKK